MIPTGRPVFKFKLHQRRATEGRRPWDAAADCRRDWFRQLPGLDEIQLRKVRVPSCPRLPCAAWFFCRPLHSATLPSVPLSIMSASFGPGGCAFAFPLSLFWLPTSLLLAVIILILILMLVCQLWPRAHQNNNCPETSQPTVLIWVCHTAHTLYITPSMTISSKKGYHGCHMVLILE